MGDVALVLRGAWSRRGVSLAVLVVAALVVGGAVTGPLFLRAAGESVLRDTLNQAQPVGRVVDDRIGAPLGTRPLRQAEAASARKLSRFPTLDRLLGAPVASLAVSSQAGRPGADSVHVPLVYRVGACAHVHLVRGRCARREGTVMVSAKTSQTQRWHVGQPLLVNGRRTTVSGVYAPLAPTGDYWGSHGYFAAYSASGGAGGSDAIFAPRSTVRDQPAGTLATGAVDRAVDDTRIRLTDVAALRAELADYGVPVATPGGSAGGDVTDTALPAVLYQATQIKSELTTPVVVVEVQLLVLCWLILFLLIANAAEARGPEVALAKLRGVPAARTLAFGLLDSLVLVAAAVPLGLGLAWVWVGVVTALHLAPDTPLVLTGGAVLAAVGAGAGAAVAAVLASWGTLRRPVVEQWRRATRRVGRRSWVVDVPVVLAAIAGLVVLARNGVVGGGATTSVLALLAPGLVVLAAALVGSRLLPGLCRAAYEPTRRRGRIGRFLAVRQLGRRPSTLRLALVLAVAFGLVTFGVDAWSVASQNQHDRAWTEVGAARVLEVSPPRGADLGAIVDRLDPTGRQAVAVSQVADYSGTRPVQLLAVQPGRFSRVAFWRSDFGPAPLSELTDRLRTTVAPVVRLSGGAMEVDLRASRLSARRPPVLVADVARHGAGLTPVALGRLHPGRQVMRGDLPPCGPRPCRLHGLHLERPGIGTYPVSARLVLTGVRVHDESGWGDVRAGLSRAGGWRAAGEGARTPRPRPSGLVLRARAGDLDDPAWRVADHPVTLPALATGAARDRTHSEGLGGQSLAVEPVSLGPALPGAGADGIVVDRAYAQRSAGGDTGVASETVWLAPSAAATFPRLLEQAGVTVVASRSASDQTAQYQRQGPALALLLFLLGAALGALLAGGGTVLSLHLAGRRRSYELASMSAQGVRRRTLLGSLYAEQWLLLAFGVGVGVASGVVGAVLALPAVPEFAETPAAPPLHYGVHLLPVLAVAASAVVVLGAVIAASSAVLVRRARFSQLREAPA